MGEPSFDARPASAARKARGGAQLSTSTIAAVVVAIVLVLVAAVAVFLAARKVVGQGCPSCRLRPRCGKDDPSTCETSLEAMRRLDALMSDTAEEYARQYGGKKPVIYLKEHPQRSFSYMKSSVYLLLRKPDGTLYDRSTLSYVALHELAHLLCNEMDGDRHGARYQLVFRRLLDIAEQRGGYDSTVAFDVSYPSSA